RGRRLSRPFAVHAARRRAQRVRSAGRRRARDPCLAGGARAGSRPIAVRDGLAVTLPIAAAALALAGAAASQEAPAQAEETEPPYVVECGPDPEEGMDVCQVDRGTYVGWRTFHSNCHTCHAQDAVGSTFAPALLPRIQLIDKTRFL